MTGTPVRRFGATAVAIVLLAVVAAVTLPGTAGSKPAGKPPKVTAVTLGVRHRVFPGFGELKRVEMNKRFQVGDTEFAAEIVEFQPDFTIQLKPRKKITSRSNEPNNPAFRIIVREKGSPRDTVWAFFNSPPHFAAKSLLAFQVLKIEFEDRPPLEPDTTSAEPGTSGGGAK